MIIRCETIIGDMQGHITVGKEYEELGSTDSHYYLVRNDQGSRWWVSRGAFSIVGSEKKFGNNIEVVW